MFIAATILSALGGVLTFLTGRDLARSWSSRGWPTTDGWISMKVTREGTSVVTNNGTSARHSNAWRETVPVYTYSVAGKPYSSSRFDFSIAGWWENNRFYEENEQVTVYYNPAQPSVSVLCPGLRAHLLLGPILLISGLAFVVLDLIRF